MRAYVCACVCVPVLRVLCLWLCLSLWSCGAPLYDARVNPVHVVGIEVAARAGAAAATAIRAAVGAVGQAREGRRTLVPSVRRWQHDVRVLRLNILFHTDGPTRTEHTRAS